MASRYAGDVACAVVAVVLLVGCAAQDASVALTPADLPSVQTLPTADVVGSVAAGPAAVTAARSAAELARAVRVATRAGAPLAGGDGAFYRGFAIAVSGEGLPAPLARDLTLLAGGDPGATLLLTLRPRLGGLDLPETPVALIGADGAVLARWSPSAPPIRLDAGDRAGLDLLLRAARPGGDARAAAEAGAAAGGLAAGRGFMLAALSRDTLAALDRSVDARLAQGFRPAVALAQALPLDGPDPRATEIATLTLAEPGRAAGAGALTLTLEARLSRSRLEAEAGLAEIRARAAADATALGFVAPAGGRVLASARYPTLALDRLGEVTLERLMAAEGGAVDRAFGALSTPGGLGPEPALLAEQCRILRDFFRDEAGLGRLDQVGAIVETLRAGGRELAAFGSEACLAAAERPVACEAGFSACGGAAPALDPAEAVRTLVDYMRNPTRDRRAKLAALMPERLTVVDPDRLTGGGGSERRRLAREEALDLLAAAKLNRYGGIAVSEADEQWWLVNITRRPALDRVLTLYVAFEDGRFDDIGVTEARIAAADLADPTSWAARELGPLMTPCNATEATLASGVTVRARRSVADCAGLDDFAAGGGAIRVAAQ